MSARTLFLEDVDAAVSDLASRVLVERVPNVLKHMSPEQLAQIGVTFKKKSEIDAAKPGGVIDTRGSFGLGAAIEAWKRLKHASSVQWHKSRNWLARASKTDFGAPVGGEGSRLRVRPLLFGLPLKPSIIVTDQGRKLAASLDKTWNDYAEQLKQPAGPGKLYLADEAKALERAGIIKRRKKEPAEEYLKRAKAKINNLGLTQMVADALMSVLAAYAAYAVYNDDFTLSKFIDALEAGRAALPT